MTISLLLIATNKYKQFIPALLTGANRYFFNDHLVEVVLFTDCPEDFASYGSSIKTIKIPSYGFPQATLYRYQMFTDHAAEITGDYVVYSDVDMAFVGEVNTDILPHRGLFATQHPGFYMKGGKYYAGGFQGGSRNEYLAAAKIMAQWIADDEKNGCTKEWHDESNWNQYLNAYGDFRVISPSYCMVDNPRLQIQWGLTKFIPKVLALTKNHKEIRS